MMTTTEIILATAIPVISGLVLLYNACQNRKLQRELANLKTVLNEKLIVRKKQFEREFQCYQELWPVLIDLKESFENALFPEYEGQRSGIIENSYTTIDLFNRTLSVNQPFLNKDIYQELFILHKRLLAKSREYHGKDDVSNDYLNNEFRDIQSLIDKACSKIHKRLIIEEY